MKTLAFWQAKNPTQKENKFLRQRKFLEDLNHIDQIWEYLRHEYGDILAVSDLRGRTREKFSYAELATQITKVSIALSNLGLKEKEVVTVISENSPRWLIIDQAIMRTGAINAVRGINSPSIELEYIIEHSGSIGLVVQSKDIWNKLSNKEILSKKLKFIINLEDQETCDVLVNWTHLISLGDQLKRAKNSLDQKTKSDIATILYTSGTTGKPKGVPLTHANLLNQIINLACIADPKPGTSVLSVLPIWHSYERSAEYFFFSCGCSQFYTNPKFLKDDIKRVKPVVMATVPRLWEAIHDGFFMALQQMPRYKQKLIKFLLNNSSKYKKNLRKLRNLELYEVSFFDKLSSIRSVLVRFPINLFASKLIFSSILKQLCGDKLKFPINGGGALPDHVDLFFESLGIDVLVGYGLTETSPVLTCRRTWANVRGSSGQPLPRTEIKIVDEDKRILNYRETGKIIVRGPQVMKGYLDNIVATNKVLSSDGWFDTGDLGFLIPNGSLVITGRAKDTIVLSSGENIEPNPLETEILSSEFIDQVQLVGQDKKSLAALIVPNLDLVKIKFIHQDILEINSSKEIKSFFKKQVNHLLRKRIGARKEEQILDCIFVNPFTIENGLLTQTLKQKRPEIQKIYEREIEEMYKKRIKN